MSEYFKKLKAHPGKGMATGMTLIGGLAGMSNESFSLVGGFVFGAAVFTAAFWPIVLWTARTQPLPKNEGSKTQ